MEFYLIGEMQISNDEIRQTIQLMGGTVAKALHENLTAIISNEYEVHNMNDDMAQAKRMRIHVVSIEFLEQALKGNPISFIVNNTICDWGYDVSSKHYELMHDIATISELSIFAEVSPIIE